MEQSTPDLLLTSVGLDNRTQPPVYKYTLPVNHRDLHQPFVLEKIKKMGKEFKKQT